MPAKLLALAPPWLAPPWLAPAPFGPSLQPPAPFDVVPAAAWLVPPLALGAPTCVEGPQARALKNGNASSSAS
jgi:hypothetical protein